MIKKNIGLLVLFLTISSLGFSQTQTQVQPQSNAAGISKEDIQNLRTAFRAIQDVLEPPQPQPAPQVAQTQQTQTAPQQDHKTVGDVLDKAVDLVDKYATSAFALTADAAKKVAPEVWHIMILQQYAKALTDILGWWSVALVTFIAFLAAGKYWVPDKDATDDEKSFHMVIRRILITLTTVFSMAGMLAIAFDIQLLINPEYFAIKDLVQIVFNR